MTVPQGERWFVLVEQHAGYTEGSRDRVTPIGEAQSLAEAQALAEQVAWTFVPLHPAMEQSRSAFRCLDGTWLVNVQGAVQAPFHFRVMIAQWFGDRPAH